ncbi:MAG: hypothetical protein HGA45_40970 [Chloroflexales bacterium]|nr:hypothetical protein [Chloroflexales bacterium]
MAVRQKRLPPDIIAADRSTLLALQSLGDYQPINLMYGVASIQQYEAALAQTEQAVILAQQALEQARAAHNEAAYALHMIVLGAKDQVKAQYGPDAAAVQMIGLTRKSDYKRSTRRKTTA